MVDLLDEGQMVVLGGDIARTLQPGDHVGLVGDLGAGKTTLARAVIRTLAGDPGLEVASPTFTIVQDYATQPPLRHADLYRVEPDGLEELGLEEDLAAVLLVEWPRARMPVTVSISFCDAEGARRVSVEADAAWCSALARQRRASAFLASAGWGAADRRPLTRDASTRRYDRLVLGKTSAVLMDAPAFEPDPDAYARRARLADGNPSAFLAVGDALRAAGLSAPRVIAADRKDGFLLLEDFGDEKVADGTIVAERYAAAVDGLAAFHAVPPRLPIAGYRPPRFDADLSAVEVAVYLQWALRRPADQDFLALWREAIEALPREDDRLALRDVHSPNLMWLADRRGIARIGWIDYQDAMIAPSAYDVVSLAQDARVDVPPDVEAMLVERYLAARPSLDEAGFRRAYHVLGAQRATRILGVFRRLDERDGKPQYLRHLPRVAQALARNLAAEPSLAALREWYAVNADLPAP
ncbi:tRNA (adenosine(37)-N6)-threonylcarbamoyltransferase complex ATPase subunit type 1 TsaE [Acuticoccus sp.]|uniref:tRNA (adenosine(37)-N6)-threonylcarbamoyltransferase complex ATPase subunit type 1 TsaE n=1 Tax=Acuticoccus sp. TaxID=1904378 RepID=UPI003B52399C